MSRSAGEPWPIDQILPTIPSSRFAASHKFERLHFEDLSVDAWSIYSPAYLTSIESFRRILSLHEQSRAEGYHFPSDRNRFIIAHGALRMILADYAQTDPRRLSFVPGCHGKPALDREPNFPDIRFNLSHSGDMAVIAVTLGYEVGVDIERIEPGRADFAIAERYFSNHEISTLRSLPEADQELAFFTCWTRKEAYIKGRGGGLSIPLRDFDVSLTPGEPAALLASRVDPSDVDHWHLLEMPTLDGYVASLAVNRKQL